MYAIVTSISINPTYKNLGNEGERILFFEYQRHSQADGLEQSERSYKIKLSVNERVYSRLMWESL